jgi:hypothetical protein
LSEEAEEEEMRVVEELRQMVVEVEVVLYTTHHFQSYLETSILIQWVTEVQQMLVVIHQRSIQ